MSPTVLWTVFGFASGSLMFSYWLGVAVLHTDVRLHGQDANPGATNLWRAGGWRIGVPGALLDYAKAALPVAAAHWAGLSGWGLVPVGIAPVLGHMFSPFLVFHGGRGTASTFGTWTGVTGVGGPLALAATTGILWRLHINNDWGFAWGLFGLLAYLLLFARSDPLLVLWALNASLWIWKSRRELQQPMRSWLAAHRAR